MRADDNTPTALPSTLDRVCAERHWCRTRTSHKERTPLWPPERLPTSTPIFWIGLCRARRLQVAARHHFGRVFAAMAAIDDGNVGGRIAGANAQPSRWDR